MRHDWVSRDEGNESAYCCVCRKERDEETPYDSDCAGSAKMSELEIERDYLASQLEMTRHSLGRAQLDAMEWRTEAERLMDEVRELHAMAKLAGYEDAREALSYLPVTRLANRPRNDREQP